jgi:hypothetical protein
MTNTINQQQTSQRFKCPPFFYETFVSPEVLQEWDKETDVGIDYFDNYELEDQLEDPN